MSERTPATALVFTLLFALAVLVGVLRLPDARAGPFVVTLAIGAAALALLVILGYGVGGWFASASPAPGWVGSSALGYVVLTVGVSVVQTSLCGSRTALLVLAGVAVSGALRRLLRRRDGTEKSDSGSDLGDRRLAAAFTAAALLIAAVPAAGIGASLPLVGENADFAIYTTLARWWQDVPADELPADPRFRDLIDPSGGYPLQVGFATVVHYLTSLSLVTGRQALDVLLGGLIALRALAVGAVWLLCRRGLRWEHGPSAVVAALAAVAATPTAASYYSFANQTAGLVLLPLALLGGIALLAKPGIGAALRASLGFAAVAGGYAPLLPYLALASIFLLVARLVRDGDRSRVVAFAGVVPIAALLLAPGLRGALLDLAGQVRFWRPGGSYEGNWGSAAEGFVAAPGWLGLWPGAGAAPPPLGGAWHLVLAATTLVTLAAIACFLWRRGDGDGEARALVLALVLLLLGLRLYPFAHGFNKSIVSLQFVVAIAVVAGLSHLSPRPRIQAALCLGFGLVLAVTGAGTLRAVAGHPARGLTPQVRALETAVTALPRGARLLVEDGRALGPRLASVLGVLATPDIALAGQAETYYFRYFTPPRGDEDHALLLSPRSPPLGFAAEPVAVTGSYRVHRRVDGVLRRPLLAGPLRLDDVIGLPHLEGLPAGSVVLAEIAASAPVTVALPRDDSSERLVLERGVHRIAAGRIGADGELRFSADGGPAWVTALAVLAPDAAGALPGPEPIRAEVVLAESRVLDGELSIDVLTVAAESERGWPAVLRLESHASAGSGSPRRILTRAITSRGALEIHTFDLADLAVRAVRAEPGAASVAVTVSALIGDGTPRGRERIPLASFVVFAGAVGEVSTGGFVRRAP